MTRPYLRFPATLAFAHRGGNTAAPENTIPAFSNAVGLGYCYLETDVHRTKDGVLVAFHDGDLERVSGLRGEIRDHLWDDLRSVDLGGGASIPTMDQLFEEFPKSRFNIEPKADESVDLLASAIQKHGAIDRVCVGSFSDKRVETLRHRLGPRLCASPGPIGAAKLIARIRSPRRVESQLSGGFGCVQLPPKFRRLQLTQQLIDGFHELGLQVHVWTINTASEMHRLLDLGVDGLMSDDAELLKVVLIERGQWATLDQ